MKILIAVDGSTSSEPVLEFAARMRWPAGSRTLVVSVANVGAGMTTSPFESAGTLVEFQALNVREHQNLVERAAHTLSETGLPCETRVVTGDPAGSLLQVARDEGADLIVVGSRGRTGLTKLLLGSVSAHVVGHAPCSVLVVRRAAGQGRAGEPVRRTR